MDIFYEESALCQSSKRSGLRYKILSGIRYVLLFLWVTFLTFTIMYVPSVICIPFAINTAFFFGMWYLLRRLQMRMNVSYDYTVVSGELRIIKVMNINRRKLVTRFESEAILQIGDVETDSYDRLSSDPNTKKVFCTSNDTAAEGKFFMYILIEDGGKKLYILECRETLLMHVMRFAKRSALASDYRPQEKKQAK